MVKGLDLSREHFREYADRYVLIGGAACDLAMGEAGLDFRATKDLDIVLCVEALDKVFVEAFWTFVRNWKYQLQEKSTGKKQYYRFQKRSGISEPETFELLDISILGIIRPIMALLTGRGTFRVEKRKTICDNNLHEVINA